MPNGYIAAVTICDYLIRINWNTGQSKSSVTLTTLFFYKIICADVLTPVFSSFNLQAALSKPKRMT
jgi:hypothetical protein